jgi:Fe-S-cluster-containing hydrogenase component 2
VLAWLAGMACWHARVRVTSHQSNSVRHGRMSLSRRPRRVAANARSRNVSSRLSAAHCRQGMCRLTCPVQGICRITSPAMLPLSLAPSTSLVSG